MINLSKGGRVNLSKDDNGNKLSKVFFGANWGAIKSGGFLGFGGGTEAVDLDASVVLMDANKRSLKLFTLVIKTLVTEQSITLVMI